VENDVFKRRASDQAACHDLCGDVVPAPSPFQRTTLPVHVGRLAVPPVVHEHYRVERVGEDTRPTIQKSANLADTLSVTHGKIRL
jgi:hypothetical protein